ncbi:hypothetical protein AO715_04000 [Xanthomonas sp. Mitacek01]|nr:hypothetical protein AO715_04000 [Xanthomonas sp. Mitacek01]
MGTTEQMLFEKADAGIASGHGTAVSDAPASCTCAKTASRRHARRDRRMGRFREKVRNASSSPGLRAYV